MEKSISPLRLCSDKLALTPGRRLTVPSKVHATTSASSSIFGTQTLCSYSHHVCSRNKLDGFEFCSRHILFDKSSPYRQCSYIYNKTGRRCHEAVLRTDRRDGYCTEHTHKLIRARALNRRKKTNPKEVPPQSMLAELESQLGASSKFACNKPTDAYETSSGSEDEMSSQLMNEFLSVPDDMDSDAESIDSEQENALKHAGVYTAEEVALIFRDKLIRLQSLYIDQFKRLQHRLREKRREFIQQSAPKAVLNDIAESKSSFLHKQDKLSALKRYHRRYGKEALLVRQLKERRLSVYEGKIHKPPPQVTCANEECSSPVLPLSKFCIHHILNDKQQVLYGPCGYGEACHQAVPVVSCTQRCVLHQELVPFEYRYCKREQEDNKEDTIDVVSLSEDVQDTCDLNT